MVETLQAENAELKADNHRLSLRVKALESELYGSRADRRQPEPDQRQETFAGMDETAQPAPPSVPKQGSATRKGKTAKKGPKPLNPNLPRVHESIPDPDLKELLCPVTGKVMKKAFSEEVSILARKPATM